MTVRPFAEREEVRMYGHRRRSFSERVETVRRFYPFYCCLMCVFPVAAVALCRSLHGWGWDLFGACYIAIVVVWGAASIVLLCGAVVRWARGVLSPGPAWRTERPLSLRASDMNDRCAYRRDSEVPRALSREMPGGM